MFTKWGGGKNMRERGGKEEKHLLGCLSVFRQLFALLLAEEETQKKS